MNLQALPEEALKEILALTEAKKRIELREEATEKFMPFAHHVYENFMHGRRMVTTTCDVLYIFQNM